MADFDKSDVSLSGLTPGEAKEFHGLFLTSFIIFVVVAIAAHFFAWEWRPWGGATSMIDSAKQLTSFLA